MTTLAEAKAMIDRNMGKRSGISPDKRLEWNRISNYTWQSDNGKYNVGCVQVGKDNLGKPILQWEAWQIGNKDALAQQLANAALAREVCDKHSKGEA